MTVDTATIGARAQSRGRRAALIVGGFVAAIVALNLLAQTLDRAVGGTTPRGVRGSSYATVPAGLAAYATLVAHYGHDVSYQRGSIAEHPPAPDSTFILAEAHILNDDETAALLEFVGAGGRLVVGGSSPLFLHKLRDDPPTWTPAGLPSWTDISPAVVDVDRVDTAAEGSWSSPGSGRVLVRDGSSSLLTIEPVGRGEILMLADTSPLQNEFLAQADNAAFGLFLAGADGRPVAFAEGVHGYGSSRGMRALPTPWKTALALLAVAAIAYLWSRARRFGPPDVAARELPPARAEYVDALAITLQRTRDPRNALTDAQRYARDRVAARAALGSTPTDDEIVAAARRIGCRDDEVSAIVGPVTNDEQVLALGRAVARLAGDNRRTQ